MRSIDEIQNALEQLSSSLKVIHTNIIERPGITRGLRKVTIARVVSGFVGPLESTTHESNKSFEKIEQALINKLLYHVTKEGLHITPEAIAVYSDTLHAIVRSAAPFTKRDTESKAEVADRVSHRPEHREVVDRVEMKNAIKELNAHFDVRLQIIESDIRALFRWTGLGMSSPQPDDPGVKSNSFPETTAAWRWLVEAWKRLW